MTKRASWIILLCITLAGFASKFYEGPGAFWVNNSLSGVFYEMFWCMLVFILFPALKPYKIALGVLVITCTLEFLQLWHPPFLQYLRQFFLFRALIGTSFTWHDFPYYFAGSGLGWLLLKWLHSLAE
jgi:hypothetical protein